MAIKKVYIGSVGPFLFDDTDDIEDPDGDFVGETQKGFVTDGQIQTTNTPTEDTDVMRKSDIDTLVTAADILTKLLTVDGAGSLLDADKLDGQEGSYYLALTDLLSKILLIDGTGSGIDSDKLDGQEGTYYGTAANVATNASDIDDLETWEATGVSGSFTTTDGKTVTVTNGLITGIV